MRDITLKETPHQQDVSAAIKVLQAQRTEFATLSSSRRLWSESTRLLFGSDGLLLPLLEREMLNARSSSAILSSSRRFSLAEPSLSQTDFSSEFADLIELQSRATNKCYGR